MSNFFSDRFDALAAAVDRRIDNELNAEFQPSPSNGVSGEVIVKTADNEQGTAKRAGTGGTIVPFLPNAAVYAGAAAVFGFVLWKVVK